ncbi:TonB-dependent receptor [Christiangramia echinicola]|uniref:Outer membrane receptor proteins, mostly Fe transport n=1 Tax=Christiangramia echinicola TaxID=279359 RepID=A0A1H1LCU5_9FLAO|nr:TonB-dependent receptor [Christiangramia echinicola]SDR72384.1 Outer membrane receptor proteins, mostly Fe transport [Christiangramia echinicola]
MLRKIILLSILALLSCQKFYSQAIFEGHIRDSLDKTVPFVNVIVKTNNDENIITYTSSDANGFYRLKIHKPGTFKINFNSLSYRSLTKSFKVEKADIERSRVFLFDISVENSVESLDEVVVEAEEPISVKNDTISIKVQSFLSGTEDVAEDVLKKIPGIDVDTDGNIRVQGKSVKKVLIEGDDLFENGYKLLTKNLDAATIDQVQILQHFSENPILKDIEDSNDVALNISLKDEVKNTLFGKASLGGGIKSVYEARANLINIKKKTKVYFFGNLNNIGADPTGDIYQLIYPNFLSGKEFIGDGESARDYYNPIISEPPLKKERYNFNNAKLASLSAIFNPSDKLKIKTLLFYTEDKNNLYRREIENFNVDSLKFRNLEESQYLRDSKVTFSKVHLSYQPDNRKLLDLVTKFNLGEFNTFNRFSFNNDLSNLNTQEKALLFDNRLTYTYKFDSVSAFQATARFIKDDKPVNFKFDDFLYGNIFPEIPEDLNTFQDLENKFSFAGVEFNYLKNLKNGNSLKIDLGYLNQSSDLKNQLFFSGESDEVFNPPDTFKNNSFNRFERIYANFSIKQRIDDFSIRPGLRLFNTYNHFENFSFSDSDSFFNIIPSIEIAFEIDDKNKILSTYRYSLRDTELKDIYQNYILTDYRGFKRGIGNFEQFRGHNILFSYVHGNWSDSFLINTSFLYSSDTNYLGTSNQINPNNAVISSIIFNNKEFSSLNLNMDQYLKSLSLNLKIKGSISYSNYENIINSQSREISNYTYKFGPEMRSVFIKGFNFHTGIEWTISEFKTSQINTNVSSLSFVDLTYKPSSRLLFEFSNELYLFDSFDATNNFVFSDLMIKYEYSKKLSLKLDIKNLFDTDSFETLSLSDTGTYSSRYRILPRYALFTVDFRF